MPSRLSRRALLKAATGSAALMSVGLESMPLTGGDDGGLERNTHTSSPTGNLPWYKSRWVGIEVGPSGANNEDALFYSRASGREIVKNLLRANAEYAVIFMKDQSFAYYNSKIVRKCPGLGERDLLQEVLDEARKHNLPIIAYCQIQYDTSAWEAHPEWRMEDWKGNGIRPRLCYNSGYLDFTKNVVSEMMAYEIAGFHFDMLDFGFSPPYGCFCKTNCQPRFREEYKMAMPRPCMPTWDEDWEKILEFRSNSNTRFCRELQQFVHSTRPEVSVDFNYHGYPPFSWIEGELPVKHAMNGDFVTAEGLPWIFGYNNPSLLSLFLAGARLGGPIQVATSRSMYEYFDPTIRPVADILWEVSTYQAHGAQVTIVDKMRYDGTQDPLVYERLGRVFRTARSRREFLGHRGLYEVGLYYSSRTRDWFARDEPMKYMQAYYGAHKALMEAHVSTGMLMDENASLQRLKEFPVVYVPSAAIITDREVNLFEDYVAAGGNLLITGPSGLYDQYGRLQNSFVLSNLTGIRLVKSVLNFQNNYLRLPSALDQRKERVLLDGIPVDWPMLVFGPMAVFKPETAQPWGELLAAYHLSVENPFGHMLSPQSILGPALFVNRHRKGKVVFVACSPDAAFVGDYRMPEHRNLIRNLIRYLYPNPPVLAEAPPNVETVLTSNEENNRLFLHFVCFSSPATAAAAPFGGGRRVLPPPMEQPIRYEANIKINKPFVKARAIGRESRVSRSGNQIRLITAEIHDVLIIDS